jgi:hypothetical protein
MPKYIKTFPKLTKKELAQIKTTKLQEFGSESIQVIDQNSLFFLLYEQRSLVAHAELTPIGPAMFRNETFIISGIGGVVANRKFQGYGRQLMSMIKDHLRANQLLGIGFSGLVNKLFYEKCDLFVSSQDIKRFVYYDQGKPAVNPNDECVIIYDCAPGEFSQKLAKYPKEEVLLPRKPDW